MHVCSFPCALIALSKMMTACAEQRLQFFFDALVVAVFGTPTFTHKLVTATHH